MSSLMERIWSIEDIYKLRDLVLRRYLSVIVADLISQSHHGIREKTANCWQQQEVKQTESGSSTILPEDTAHRRLSL